MPRWSSPQLVYGSGTSPFAAGIEMAARHKATPTMLERGLIAIGVSDSRFSRPLLARERSFCGMPVSALDSKGEAEEGRKPYRHAKVLKRSFVVRWRQITETILL
jgi:hypothetical protein